MPHITPRTLANLITVGATVGILALGGCRSAQEAFAVGDAADANPGPCPRAFALHDAARTVEFSGDGAERVSNVAWTGEIASVRSLCRYFGDVPIEGDLDMVMDFGRGPAAQGDTHTYRMWVAVTRKNIDVIDKLEFPVTVTFAPGQDRVRVSERIDRISIPRANDNTSGENFEIIAGFAVDPQQRLFNRDGKRFRLGSGAGSGVGGN